MKLDMFQVDAFASRPFEGNPAAICPLESWLDDGLMQAIAEENNLAETAFFVAENGGYRIRWFTPLTEVDLCGHATLASAWVLFNELGYQGEEIHFESNSGPLIVGRHEVGFSLDFPAQIATPATAPNGMYAALGLPEDAPQACLFNEDYVVVLSSQQQLADLQPDFASLAKIDARGVLVTAPGEQHDFVNRFFAPQVGINEDPVTGSAFTKLIPYWSQQLGKRQLRARQISRRGGEVLCELHGDRVLICGSAAGYMQAQINLPS